MPKGGRARSPFRWVRRLLLAFGLFSVAAIAILLMAYQFGKGSTSTPQDADPGESGVDASTLTAGQSFDYTQWTDGRRIFRIQAARSRQDRDDTAFLETVVLDIFRQDENSNDGAGETTYTVTSRQARVNQNNWSARLEGDVVISGWGNVELEARVLELRNGGQVLESVGAVAFRYAPDLVGRATKLRIDRRNGTVRLDEGVHIKSIEGAEFPLRLDSQRLVFRRDEGLLRAIDDVTLEMGDRRLTSRSLTLFLDDDLRSLRQLVARWDVRAEQRPSDLLGDEPELRLSAELFEMRPDEDRPEVRRMILRGEEGVARVAMVDREGVARQLTGRTLEGLLREGELEWLEGWGAPLLMEEFLDFPEPYPLRRACAQRAVARFDAGGELRQLQLEQQVDLGDEDVHLSGGERAVLDLKSGKIDIQGPSVELLSDRGDLVAQRFDYTQETGFIRASGGVRGSLASGGAITLATTPFGEGSGPLQVESKEAIFSGDPRGFIFKGGVRAWRDTNLLITEQLRGDEAAEQLAASGGVKTVWTPTAELAGRNPIEVTAERLTWDRARDQLVYDGSVNIVQGTRKLICDQTVVELARSEPVAGEETTRAERMICRGGVELLDSADGQQVEGDLAVYTLHLEIVEVFGDNVQLVDSQSNSLKGRYLLYDLAKGSVQLRSQPPEGAALGGGKR